MRTLNSLNALPPPEMSLKPPERWLVRLALLGATLRMVCAPKIPSMPLVLPNMGTRYSHLGQ
jgi:hypothetical protein